MTDDQALAELRQKCSDLEAAIGPATAKLHAALLAGAPTGELRRFLAELSAQLEAGAREFEAAAARISEHRESEIGRQADDLAKQAAGKLKRLLASLQPPAPPSASVN